MSHFEELAEILKQQFDDHPTSNSFKQALSTSCSNPELPSSHAFSERDKEDSPGMMLDKAAHSLEGSPQLATPNGRSTDPISGSTGEEESITTPPITKFVGTCISCTSPFTVGLLCGRGASTCVLPVELRQTDRHSM